MGQRASEQTNNWKIFFLYNLVSFCSKFAVIYLSWLSRGTAIKQSFLWASPSFQCFTSCFHTCTREEVRRFIRCIVIIFLHAANWYFRYSAFGKGAGHIKPTNCNPLVSYMYYSHMHLIRHRMDFVLVSWLGTDCLLSDPCKMLVLSSGPQCMCENSFSKRLTAKSLQRKNCKWIEMFFKFTAANHHMTNILSLFWLEGKCKGIHPL